jgi:hypothetical protein
MNALTEMITQQLAGSAVSEISNKLGADPNTTGKAIGLAVPLLISALARNASTPEGAQALNQAVAEDHDGSILDNIQDFLRNIESGGGAGILGHILGDNRGDIENGIAQRTGLDLGAAGKLLETMAPLVMGAVGKTQQEQGLDAGGLATYLDGQHQQAQNVAPDVIGMLSNVLGSDQGESSSQLGRLVARFFGK